MCSNLFEFLISLLVSFLDWTGGTGRRKENKRIGKKNAKGYNYVPIFRTNRP